jgi:hypothetical protein
MDKSRDEIDHTIANLFKEPPEGESCSLPMPRFGKTPASAQVAQSLPDAGGTGHENFRLSWVDEEELGVRVFITAGQGPQGMEILVSVEGVRPDLLGHGVSVALLSEKGRESRGMTVHFDQRTTDQRGCTGKGSFGSVDALRKLLGDKVLLDVFVFVYPDQRATA